MFNPSTFLDLCMAMKTGASVTIKDAQDKLHQGTINGIAREDGSGYCWNVTLSDNGRKSTIFFRERRD